MSARWRLAAALLAVWILWGSTYYGIRVALETLPPLRMAFARLVIAGSIAMLVSRARGGRWPTRPEWASCAAIGVLMFVGGNGSVVLAERTVSSGLVAVLVSTVPVYGAVIGALTGRPPTRRQWAGVLVGMVGVVVLQGGAELSGNFGTTAMLAGGSIAWAIGSALAQRLPLPPGAMSSGAEMLCGGLALGALSVATGEPPTVPSAESLAAVAYLVTFGSLVAFSAYGYLLRNASLPVAMSYAYVNPLVAVALGWALGGERLDAAGWAGLVILVSGVALLTSGARTSVPAEAPAALVERR